MSESSNKSSLIDEQSQIEQKPNQVQKLSQTPQNQASSMKLPVLSMLQQFDEFADYIMTSDYKKGFEKRVDYVDDKGEKKSKLVVERGDIIACMALGHELGISPMGSIALGKQLNAKSYFSVIRGRELGLDPITSISKIYNIQTSNGTIVSLDVSIITKGMLDSGCKLDYIMDYETVPKYINAITKEYIGHFYNLLDNTGSIGKQYYIITGESNPEELKSAMKDSSRITITASGTTKVTALKVTRPSKNFEKTFYYSLQDATDAELFRGYHSYLIDNNGKPLYVTGRSNWNSHPATMLRNRVTSIAGRIAAADKLQGSYSHEEAAEIINVESISEV